MVWLVSALPIYFVNNMYSWIYRLPLWLIIYAMFVVSLIYTVINYKISKQPDKYHRHWKIFNYLLLVISIAAILNLTLLSRKSGINKLVLTPFESIKVCKYQPEMWRSLLMNIALFFPFGLSFSSILQTKCSIRKTIVCTIAIGMLVSLLIESMQYFCSLGEAWTDDVICNTIGVFLGVTHILFLKFYYYLMSKQKNELS